ncbi:MAG: acetylornithine transaminase [Gammaproteobacteria bacterium]|nr:acetylornithine transaminase [Gammaproteobacteria bacterium]MCW8988637.1 acetylornithine transaminase [Gammaproteobacteria bacterium]MCW9030074.1 acetylornithine transaminase [Gammaproteobacteria bacterium]
MTDTLMHNYAPLPVNFEKGEGAQLWDTEGKTYLDALGGIAVCGLGHAHPAVTKAICEQAGKLVHTSNIYGIKNQRTLADKLTALSGMDNVFFSNSGAEANEAAIKLARLFGHSKNIDQPAIIVMEGSFHGRTMATLTATGNRKIQAGFEPLVQGFVRAPYNDIEAIKNIAKNNPNVVAVLVEPVTGEGGIKIPADDYLNQIRDICDQQNWLMMLDEIQTGICRTGKWFAHQHNNITPDVMTLAKALGNGVPIGACLAKGEAAKLFQPGHHGSTYGGNPLVTSAALAVIDTCEKDKLAERAASLSVKMLTGFKDNLSDLDAVVDIRGKGLMIGIQLDRPCAELVKAGLDAGILINVTAGDVVRLLPPLIISDEQADQIVSMVSDVIRAFVS